MFPILISKLHRKYHKSKLKPGWVSVYIAFFIISFFILFYIVCSKSSRSKVEINITESLKKEKISSILCYIPFSRERLRVAKVINETWGSKCDKLIFYGNFGKDSIPEKYHELNIEKVNVTEKYEYLWGKTKSVLAHLYHNYGNVCT